MNQTDLIILTVYLISVYYVLRQAWYSIPIISNTVIKHEGNVFDYEALKDFLDIKFNLGKSYPLNQQLTQLETTISNKSNTATLTIDWEKGSLTNFQGGDRRLFRLIEGMQKGDQAKIQASSTISPRRSLKVNLTAEDLLEAKEDGGLSATKQIVNIEQLAKDQAAKPDPNEKDKAKIKAAQEKIQKLKTIYKNFMDNKEPLKFSVRFPIQITNISEGAKRDSWGFVDCNFSISHVRTNRRDQLPWNPPKK
ncbi:MAG: hypothetical protein ACKO7W_22845 [Elainella sp.]